MKAAMNDFLSKGPSAPTPGAGPSDEEMDSMFGEPANDMEGPDDALKEALSGLGFEVDESKLSQIKGILEGGGEPKPLGGMETPEEEALEAGGSVPAPMRGRPAL